MMVMLEDKISKLKEKLCKQKKTKMLKKQKQAQNFLSCMLIVIVMLVVRKEITSSRMKYLVVE